MISKKEGVVSDLILKVRLVGQLMIDPRVSPWVKLVPVGALLYAVFPDLAIGPVDDALVLWVGTSLFIELCPQGIVQEHLNRLQGTNPPAGEHKDVIDGEFKDIDLE